MGFVDLHFRRPHVWPGFVGLHFDFGHIKTGFLRIENVSRRVPAVLFISSTASTRMPRLKKHSETNMF